MGLFKNVREDISEMFMENEHQIEDLATLNYIYLSYGIDIKKEGGNRGFHFDRKLSEEDDEYLILVAFIYKKEMKVCARCDEHGMFKRVLGRRSFHCPKCAFQMYPTANTIFSKSRVPLKHWFRVIKNMAVGDVCIKDIERAFNIHYTTAHRMYHLIKKSEVYNRIRLFHHTVEYKTIELEMEYEIAKLISNARKRYDNIKNGIYGVQSKYNIDKLYTRKNTKKSH